MRFDTDARRHLADVLERRQMTQKALAEALGISQAQVSLYLSGENRPGVVLRSAIEVAYGIPSDLWLLPPEAERLRSMSQTATSEGGPQEEHVSRTVQDAGVS